MTINYFAAASFVLWMGAVAFEIRRGNYLLAVLFGTWAASAGVSIFMGGK